MAQTGQAPEPMPMPKMTEADRIGDILRRVREHREEDLESISDYLRIRPDYLYALENSQYDQLPADAYVIGFLRTYAAYLGLDGRGAIDQYRREMAGRRRKPQLTMPQPMPEGRAPTVVILVAAAVAFLIVYGIWYGLSTPDEDITKKPLPITEVTDPVTTDNSSIVLSVPSAPEALPVPENIVPVATDEKKAEEIKPEEKKAEEKKPEEKKVEDKKAEDKKVEEKPAAAPLQDKKTEAPKTETPKTEIPKTEPVKAEPPKPEAAKTEAPKTEQPAPVPADASAQTEAPKSYGEKNKTRVTVRADKDSWVLVTDNKGVTVFERTLKAGETYNVPADRNLSLTTGNVAGVSLLIDGNEMPRLPATGKVARSVPLEPDKLRSRLTAPLPPQPMVSPAAKDAEKSED
jgi:cytoskeletal protein RodZ